MSEHPLRDLETELRAWRPRAPSADTQARIAAALEPTVAADERGRGWSSAQWLWWAAAASFLAAAGGLGVGLAWRAARAPDPVLAIVPHAVESEALELADMGVLTAPGERPAAGRMVRVMDRWEWRSADGRLRHVVAQPRSEVIYVSLATD